MSASPPSIELRFTERELAEHLASALGETKALEVVRAAVGALGLPGDALDREQAFAVLDTIAKQPGLVGVTARFVKSRLILSHGA